MHRLFISDLHLQPERPEITRAFLCFLEHIAPGADELYLLGDIFEYWIGDDAPLPGLEAVTGALSNLSSRNVQLFFQHGNRDFLVGERFAAQIGATLLPEEHCIELNEGTALLMHGDQLCTDDYDYQQFRAQVRNPDWQRHFLSLSIEERLATAQRLRQQSREQGAMKSDSIMDVNAAAVAETMQRANVALLIHGHTHRPAIHPNPIEGIQGERIVLGDWSSEGWYLSANAAGHRLIRFTPES